MYKATCLFFFLTDNNQLDQLGDVIPFPTPISQEGKIVTVDKIYKSKTAPLRLVCEDHRVMFKKDNLLPEKAVMVMAVLFQSIMDMTLRRPPKILTYKVLPLTSTNLTPSRFFLVLKSLDLLNMSRILSHGIIHKHLNSESIPDSWIL